MAKQPAKQAETEISVLAIETGTITFRVVGRTPLIMNRMSEKAKRQLVLPAPRKNATERASSPKHVPLEEYRASAYRTLSDRSPTRLIIPGGAFKTALADVAIDIPGTFKTTVGRLTGVTDINIPVFGVPVLKSDVVRMADAKKTPDIRFRACLPRWACEVTYTYVRPMMTAQAVAQLFAAAGIIIGIGDGRNQKGKLSFGSFEAVGEDDAEFAEIVRDGGKAAQDAALEAPQFFDEESEELVAWYDAEIARRRDAPHPQTKRRQRNGLTEAERGVVQ